MEPSLVPARSNLVLNYALIVSSSFAIFTFGPFGTPKQPEPRRKSGLPGL